ncbi:MAG: hypothetical protein R2771_01345 [Saprospiraceae bacterium]
MDINYFYLIGIGILFLLAISDLIVGVSNDAVNFLNAAVGNGCNFQDDRSVAAVGGICGCGFFNWDIVEVARELF